MTPADLTLIAPINEVLTLSGLPRLGLEHLAVAQLALVGGDRALGALPMRRRRRRRGGGIGFFGLCCCLLPLAALALVAYLVWARKNGKDPKTAFGDLRSLTGGGSGSAPNGSAQQAPPPPGAGHQAPPPPGAGHQAPPPPGAGHQAPPPLGTGHPASPPPSTDRPAPPTPPGEGPLDPPAPSSPDRPLP